MIFMWDAEHIDRDEGGAYDGQVIRFFPVIPISGYDFEPSDDNNSYRFCTPLTRGELSLLGVSKSPEFKSPELAAEACEIRLIRDLIGVSVLSGYAKHSKTNISVLGVTIAIDLHPFNGNSSLAYATLEYCPDITYRATLTFTPPFVPEEMYNAIAHCVYKLVDALKPDRRNFLEG